jgi:hypothetical protein
VVAGCLLAGLLGCVAGASGQDRVAGLLTLPDVFGAGPCDRFTPMEVPLFAAPEGSEVLGAIRVARYWTFHEMGGCEGLVVVVENERTGVQEDLPTLEYDYEAPAAIVLQERDDWFLVRLQEGTAWLRASPGAEFFPLERLLVDRLTHITEVSEGRLWPEPGADEEAGPEQTGSAIVPPGSEVRVLEARWVEGELWLRVEVLSHSVCDGLDDPTVVETGWLPGHGAHGEPTVWFYSRGC